MKASPDRTFMTRNKEEAREVESEWKTVIGKKVSSLGRITDTLKGVEFREVQFGGRPMYQVIPQLHNHDPLFDA